MSEETNVKRVQCEVDPEHPKHKISTTEALSLLFQYEVIYTMKNSSEGVFECTLQNKHRDIVRSAPPYTNEFNLLLTIGQDILIERVSKQLDLLNRMRSYLSDLNAVKDGSDVTILFRMPLGETVRVGTPPNCLVRVESSGGEVLYEVRQVQLRLADTVAKAVEATIRRYNVAVEDAGITIDRLYKGIGSMHAEVISG